MKAVLEAEKELTMLSGRWEVQRVAWSRSAELVAEPEAELQSPNSWLRAASTLACC